MNKIVLETDAPYLSPVPYRGKRNESSYLTFVAEKLAAIKNETILVPVYFKADIIISYLKNHCIKNDWIKGNPELAKRITSGTFITTQVEPVFKRCNNHKVFLNDYESYIRMQILN